MKPFFDWLATMKPALDWIGERTAPMFIWIENLAGRQLSSAERTVVLMIITAALVFILV